jgi:CheY-like chemotaxis protein
LCDNPDAVADKKILLVDYDQRSLDGLAALFEPVGFAVRTAMDGLSAWEKYQIERPDLVVLEAILPRLHGFDLTKRIVQDSGGGVPVVIITGLYRGPQYRHEALTAFGAAEYMEKPVDEARLLQVVQDCCGKRWTWAWTFQPRMRSRSSCASAWPSGGKPRAAAGTVETADKCLIIKEYIPIGRPFS